MPPDARVHRRLFPATTQAARLETRDCAIPPIPPRVEEIVAVMRQAGIRFHGARIRGLIVVLWRAGLRISEALDLAEADLDPERGALLVRRGKGGKRRESGMDDWGWEQLRPWVEHRAEMPIGPLFCIVNGLTPRTTVVGLGCE